MIFFATKITSDEKVSTIHMSICDYLPSPSNAIELGEFYSCGDALEAAKKIDKNSNGCFHCCLLSYTKDI